jgi:hypothetical protein
VSPKPGTLVMDDGELGDVRTALEELGVEYTYLRGSATEGLAFETPSHLLVATARRALRAAQGRGRSADSRAARTGGAARPVRIAFAGEDSPALRGQLRELGFDYLVRPPVHPGALRLLLLRALYRGPERRVEARYPVGAEVAWRTGLRRHRATLLEIALRGCRLQAARPAEPDARVTVIVPKDLTGTRPLWLPGWVLRCEPGPRGEGGFVLGIAFERLRASAERALRELLKRMLAGLAVAGRDPAVRPTPAGGDEEGERRGSPRSAWQGRVLACQSRAERALVGRDLSTGGMLVEQSLELRLGDEVGLAIFGRDGEEPIAVRARVVREDDRGAALQFVDVGPAAAARLEALVAGLPGVERLADGETEALGTVMAEIVGEKGPEGWRAPGGE